MEKHFELTDETIEVAGKTLHRIRCTRDCKWAKTGDLGGFIEKEDNLSGNAWVSDNAWVSGDARVYGDAWVSDNARVSGNARVYGDARVSDNAQVYGDAWVSGNARVYGNAWVSGNARVYGNDDHCGFDVFGSIGRHTHAYRTSDGGVEITCGCFHGDIEAFEAKVRHTHGDSQYAREYLAIAHVIRVKFGLA